MRIFFPNETQNYNYHPLLEWRQLGRPYFNAHATAVPNYHSAYIQEATIIIH